MTACAALGPSRHAASTPPSAVEWVAAALWLVFAFVAEHHAIAHVAAVASRVIGVVGAVAGVVLLGVTS